jgi:hypothetical protein
METSLIRYTFKIIGWLVLTIVMWAYVMTPPSVYVNISAIQQNTTAQRLWNTAIMTTSNWNVQSFMRRAAHPYFNSEWEIMTGDHGLVSYELTHQAWEDVENGAIDGYSRH